MVLDWYRHCEKIHRTKKLDVNDSSDKKSVFKQELYYIRYLIQEQEMSQLQCYKEWIRIKNGRAHIFKSDPDQLTIEFFNVYKAAKARKEIPGPLNPINIYKSEIDYLNGLDVPQWIKEFWLVELVYYKFAHQIYDKVELSPTVASWCMRQVKHLGANNKDFHSNRDQIGVANVKTGSIKLTSNSNYDYNVFVPNFISQSEDDEIQITLSSLNEIGSLLELLHGNIKICEQCGKKFKVSSKSQRNLCNKCYSIYFKKLQREWIAKKRNLKNPEKCQEN